MTATYKSAAELMEKEYTAAIAKAKQGDDSGENKEAVKEEKALAEKKAAKEKAAGKADAKTGVQDDSKQPSKAVVKSGGTVVRLVNCSGSKSAGASAISKLKAAGFTVINGGSGELMAQTTVISTTNNGAIVGRLSQVPFAHKLRISRDGAADCDGVVMLGADYK